MDSGHLLVPIKVQALVIDDLVVQKGNVVEFGGRLYASDGHWSPKLYDYKAVGGSALGAPGPAPFYGAERKSGPRQTQQLVVDPKLVAQKKDRGVYLRWILPAGLRHSYTPGELKFPPLPDHWLIVRFAFTNSNLETKAWFIDGGAIVGEDAPLNLLLPGSDKYVGKRVGKVFPLEGFANARAAGERTTINAVGHDATGSPTFTAFIAENRNVFSWHDELNDLRTPNSDDEVRAGTTISYCLLGWYRDLQNEPLSRLAPKVTQRRDTTNKFLGWLIDPPGWTIDTSSSVPLDLSNRRSVFHGLVAHINYWSQPTYKGQMLGYPGSPPVPGVMTTSTPAFRVGVGNSAEDALVSLVSGEYSGEQEQDGLAKKQPNLWKALEAVIYRQSETLVKSWNVAPRDMTVHQNSFATHEAGKIWYIRAKTNKGGDFPSDPNETAAQTAIQPTPDNLAQLKKLNQLQTEVDEATRALAVSQQELYARWWKLSDKSRQAMALIKSEEKECRTLVTEVTALRDKLNVLKARLEPLPQALAQTLHPELELKYDAAPRFWMPADPVIVVKNSGLPTKRLQSRELACRLPEQIITSAKVVVNQVTNTFSTAAGVAAIAAAAQQHLPACPPILNALLNEASIVEQAVRNLAERTLPDGKRFRDAESWSEWTDRLVKDLTWAGVPTDKISFEPEALNISPDRLVDLWVKQPWSPLFVDWQITWFPTQEPASAEHPFGNSWRFGDADFVPAKRSIPDKGYTVRGRSLLSPIDERIFREPVETLGKMLAARRSGEHKDSAFPPAVLEVLERYEFVWNKTLHELPRGGLMGQALTGFHQALLHRDVTLPRVNPDSNRPWIKSASLKALEKEVETLLDIPNNSNVPGERLAPPAPVVTTTIPFSLIRAGALRIDELWLVDDFGQWADLLGDTTAHSTSSGQVFHPRIRWHDEEEKVFAMPPRVLQAVRLNFRFTAASENRNEPPRSEPALNSICGWILYNRLDQALVLCDAKGDLMGHLVIAKEQREMRIGWEAGANGVAITDVPNPTLKAFAESLVEPIPSSKPRLLELLNLMEKSLERIRPATARGDTIFAGRPLALVSASVGLELFGREWVDPLKPPPSDGVGDAAQSLNALRVAVNLGYSHSVEDGLIGYFKDNAYERIVVPQVSDQVPASDYIRNAKVHGLRVGFGAPERITLLMDPWGSVQAACGLVPAKTITLADPELNRTVAQMEASFRVGPILLQADRIALPTPTGNKGTWNFSGPLTEQKPAAVVALDPRYFNDQPVVAAEGRLLLLNEE